MSGLWAMALLALLAGCGGSDLGAGAGAGPDGAAADSDGRGPDAADACCDFGPAPDGGAPLGDAAPDAPDGPARDADGGDDATGADGGVPRDAAGATDGGPEVRSDARADDGAAGPDAAPDAAADAGPDATGDAGPDAGPDVAPDVPPDAAPDAAPDVPPDVPPDAGPVVGECPGLYGAPIETGRLDTLELDEASGIAGSRLTPGVLWLHNDSGDGPRLFAVQEDGRVLAILTLQGVSPRDWEDLAAAPCPDGDGPCLWVGDIGNNGARRTDLTVYVVRERPLPPPGDSPVELTLPPDWTLPYTYPGEPVDSEGMAVPPDGSTFYVFEKANHADVRVFAHPGPLVDGEGTALVEVAAFTVTEWSPTTSRLVTGADIHPGGRRLLLRTYNGSIEYRFGEGEGIADLGALVGTVVARGPSSEPQGEAACYEASGLGFWTVSESSAGNQPLHYYPCL